MNLKRLKILTEHKAHDILGVSHTATSEEIKSAYRKLARQHHPDIGGDPEKFKEVSSAYDYLTGGGTQKERRRQAAEYGDGVSATVSKPSSSKVRTPSKTRIPAPTPAVREDQKKRLEQISNNIHDEKQTVIRRFIAGLSSSAKAHGHDHMEKTKDPSGLHPQSDFYREMHHVINHPVKPNESADHLGVIIDDMGHHLLRNSDFSERTHHLVGDRHLYGAYRNMMEHPGINKSHLRDITKTMIIHGGGNKEGSHKDSTRNIVGWKNIAKALRKRDTQEGQKPNDTAWAHHRQFMEDLIHHPADTNSDVSRMIIDHHNQNPHGIDPHIVDIARKKIESQEAKNESVVDMVSKVLNENFYN